MHPFALLFDEERSDQELRLGYPYFHRTGPLEFENEISYAAPDVAAQGDAYYWIHSLSDILGALLCAGLILASLSSDLGRDAPGVLWYHRSRAHPARPAGANWALRLQFAAHLSGYYCP